MTVLSELRNRGVEDVCIVACDGLKGLPDAVTATWPRATVQTCVIHWIRASLRLASKQHHPALAAALKVLYLADRELITPKAREINQVAPHWKKALNQFSLFFEDRLNVQ